MNRRRRPYAFFLQLAFVATLLMALAPLVSRWQQAHADAPARVMPMGDHAMPGHDSAAHAMPMADMPRHHDMATHDMAAHGLHGNAPAVPAAPVPPPQGEHAGHGEACEYCMMASRLMPWLAVLILLLPALPVIAPLVLRAVAGPRSLRWPAHAARGPPLNA
ncbi:hypothetical protein ACLB90_05390 [Stenotrophomonas sp. LGBM10]|uniref:hypothetical protein n=1 Tax=Stenotrophomonas sp. LGBM10 TaxID=3390038 RepID=UPI00398B5E0B